MPCHSLPSPVETGSSVCPEKDYGRTGSTTGKLKGGFDEETLSWRKRSPLHQQASQRGSFWVLEHLGKEVSVLLGETSGSGFLGPLPRQLRFSLLIQSFLGKEQWVHHFQVPSFQISLPCFHSALPTPLQTPCSHPSPVRSKPDTQKLEISVHTQRQGEIFLSSSANGVLHSWEVYRPMIQLQYFVFQEGGKRWNGHWSAKYSCADSTVQNNTPVYVYSFLETRYIVL